jgi:hypothetical protein
VATIPVYARVLLYRPTRLPGLSASRPRCTKARGGRPWRDFRSRVADGPTQRGRFVSGMRHDVRVADEIVSSGRRWGNPEAGLTLSEGVIVIDVAFQAVERLTGRPLRSGTSLSVSLPPAPKTSSP